MTIQFADLTLEQRRVVLDPAFGSITDHTGFTLDELPAWQLHACRCLARKGLMHVVGNADHSLRYVLTEKGREIVKPQLGHANGVAVHVGALDHLPFPSRR